MAAERIPRPKARRRRFAPATDGRDGPAQDAVNLRRINRLKDDVYREMMRLESNRPGSEMGLALALLRAVVHRPAIAEEPDFQRWIQEVCTLGLTMIEASLKGGTNCPVVE